MASSDINSQRFREIVEHIFNRWTALKLCVEHGMGGKSGHQTAIEIMNYTYEYCTKNENCSQSDIVELLEDIMDEEFESICDDNSIPEIAACLVRYLALVKEQKFDEIAAELLRLPACTHWLMPQFKVQYAPKADDDSSSDDDDDETDSDEEMEDDQPEKPTRKAKSQSKASGSGGMEVEEEDGWTTVRRKH